MVRPKGAGSEDTILGAKSLPRRARVFPLLRLPILLEMESILEVDAVGGH
jgi:hypothetical protein